MEPHKRSLVSTPRSGVVAQRRRKSKSYRLSYRSCMGAASRLGITPRLTAQRLSTFRRQAKSHNITAKVAAEQLALLLKTEWQLSYVTPLNQFRHTQLKSYSRQLAEFIAAEKQQGLAVDVEGAHTGLKVSFSVVQGMVETDDDAETVFIQIHSKKAFAKPDESHKSVWRGWLTCINGSPQYLRSLPTDFTCLPLFGSNGAAVLTTLVKSWFQRTFDCCIGPLQISHTSLQWLVALWTNCQNESNIQQLKMIWTVPVVPPLQVTYAVNPNDAWALWNSVRENDMQVENNGDEEAKEESTIDIEEVTRFIQALKSHFYRHFRLDLSAASLSEVSTALGSAKYSGKIKISNSKYMITTLTLLTECALLKMPL